MRVISAYLLAVLGGNSSPQADDLKKILDSVGIEGPDDRIDDFLKEVDGKDIAEVVAGGLSKLASVPSGGGAIAAAPAAGGGGAAAAAGGGDAKKEEKKEESEEEEDDDMGFSLFD